jgi:hypothetical protein
LKSVYGNIRQRYAGVTQVTSISASWLRDYTPPLRWCDADVQAFYKLVRALYDSVTLPGYEEFTTRLQGATQELRLQVTRLIRVVCSMLSGEVTLDASV